MTARSLLIAEHDSISPATSVVIPAMMTSVQEVEVIVAHSEPVALRVGDMFLETDTDQRRTNVEAEAMAPVPAPQILWHKPPALAPAALPGTALGHLGEPSARPRPHPERRL